MNETNEELIVNPEVKKHYLYFQEFRASYNIMDEGMHINLQ